MKQCIAIAALLWLLAACQTDNSDTILVAKNLGSPVELDAWLEKVSDRPSREQTTFDGDHAWTIDNSGRLLTSLDRGYTWEPARLPADGRIRSMQMEDGGRLGVVATENGALLRTADSGATWSRTNLIEYVGDGIDLEWRGSYDEIDFDTKLQNGFWIDFCQIYRTADGGQSWTRHADTLQDTAREDRCVANVVADASTGMLLADVDISGRMLTSGRYLFSSDDNGANWKEVCSLDEIGLLLESVKSCFSLDGLPDVWRDLDGDSGYGDMESLSAFSDRIEREIFVEENLPIPESILSRLIFVGLTRDDSSGRIWYDDGQRLAYTDDLGENWKIVSSGMPSSEHVDFSLHPDRGFAVFQYQYLAVSDDIGKTWRVVNRSPLNMNDHVALPEHNRIVIATESGLATVDTETLDWRDVNGVGESQYLLAASGSVVWSFATAGDVHRSVDAGVTWTQLPVNLEDEYFYLSEPSCDEKRCVLTGSREDTAIAQLRVEPFEFDIVEVSEHVSDLEDDYVVETLFDGDLNRGWLATTEGRIYGTLDSGRTWKKLATLRDEITDLSRAPGGSYLIARGYASRYLWSRDGEDFERLRVPVGRKGYVSSLCWINDSVAVMTAEDADGEDVYLASEDGGYTWGPTSWMARDNDCVIPGGLVTLNGLIARVK